MSRLLLTYVCLLAILLAFGSAQAAPACKLMVHNSQQPPYSAEVTVVIGTDRAGANSVLIADVLISQLTANSNMKINLINLADLPASMFKSDYFAVKSAGFVKNFVSPIEKAGALIFVIPEYDGAIPGILSYYMNHMRSTLEHKHVALVGLSAGRWGARAALDVFKGTLTHRRARVAGDLQINIENIESKIKDGTFENTDALKRLKALVEKLNTTLNAEADGITYQNLIAKVVKAEVEQNVNLRLNTGIEVSGKLAAVHRNENGTLSYVQFGGPTKILYEQAVIPGQDTGKHPHGYGMPVGSINGFKKGWYKKENLEDGKLTIGKKIKLEYESGVVIDGTLENLTYDKNGNLQIMTFKNVWVRQGEKILFNKKWGSFDVAVADYVEDINRVQNDLIK